MGRPGVNENGKRKKQTRAKTKTKNPAKTKQNKKTKTTNNKTQKKNKSKNKTVQPKTKQVRDFNGDKMLMSLIVEDIVCLRHYEKVLE